MSGWEVFKKSNLEWTVEMSCQFWAGILIENLSSGGELADYPALSVDRAGGGNPLYAEDTPNQEFLIWCAPIQEFLIRCTPIQEFEFTDSVLVFVRGVIWHQEGYYCYIISQMNTFIINKILPRKCLPLLTACRHLWQLHLVVLKFIQRNDTSRWR